MPYNEKSRANLKPPFPKGHDPRANPNWRPKGKSLVTAYNRRKKIKAVGLSPEDILHIEKIILSGTTEELKAVAKDDAAPVYYRTLALAALNDMKNGATKTVDRTRANVYGAALQKLDLSLSAGHDDASGDAPAGIKIEIINRADQVDKDARPDE